MARQVVNYSVAKGLRNGATGGLSVTQIGLCHGATFSPYNAIDPACRSSSTVASAVVVVVVSISSTSSSAVVVVQ